MSEPNASRSPGDIIETNARVWERIYNERHPTYPAESFVRIAHRLISPEKDRRVLDFGCGSGEILVHLATRGFEVSGAEVSETALQVAGQRLTAAGYPDRPLVKVPAGSAFPFPDASFDVVVSWGVLLFNTWETLPKMVAEIERVLVPGGRFIGTMTGPRDYFRAQGRPLGNDLYTLADGSNDGLVALVVSRDDLPKCFPGRDLEVGEFVHSFGGRDQHHWLVTYRK